ncbi:MAG: serine hydrolase, partial [Pseudomonadales bacterium]|nr:serine hydrolase [Pseudomonadales bacterium]
MQKHTDAGDIQGGVTLVARQGKVVHFSTHGEMDVDKGRAMEPDAIFIMASSAKPVIAVAALMLVDEGLISLSDPVSKYIPEFAQVNKAVVEGHEDQNAGLLWFGAQGKKENLE